MSRCGIGMAFCAMMVVLGGCQSFSKQPSKDAQARNTSNGNSNDPFWMNAESKGQTPTVNIQPENYGGGKGVEAVPLNDGPGGVLAGRVVDNFNRAPGSAIIQVQATDGGGGPQPQVESTQQGHFLVRGLTPGRSYRVVARVNQNGKTLVGEEIAQPPNAKMLISMSEDYGGRYSQPYENTTPSLGGGVHSPPPVAELGAPRTNDGYFPPPSGESIASSEPNTMPRANIPPPGLPDVSATPPIEGIRSTGPTPDCLIAGGRILTLRLADTNGNVWDFSQHQGKLVLIDLWGSWCAPCLRAIPELVRVQQQYRLGGLEVIGIACENGHTSGQNVAAVRAVQRRMPNVNYRLLVAGEPGIDPVRAQFQPTAFPSLILVDADGTILWRGVGGNSIAEVESIIRKRLGGP